MDTLYKQHIIDHYRHPRNAGRLNRFTSSSKVINASCGDEIELFVLIEDGVVKDLKYDARGCAISIAAISMLSEKVIGRHIDELSSIKESEVLSLVGMDASSGRLKCAILSLEALTKATVQLDEK